MKYLLIAPLLLCGCTTAPSLKMEATPRLEIDRKASIQSAEIEYVRQTGRLPNRAYIDPETGKTYMWEQPEPVQTTPRLVI